VANICFKLLLVIIFLSWKTQIYCKLILTAVVIISFKANFTATMHFHLHPEHVFLWFSYKSSTSFLCLQFKTAYKYFIISHVMIAKLPLNSIKPRADIKKFTRLRVPFFWHLLLRNVTKLKSRRWIKGRTQGFSKF
jgi:hypothetical protein